MFKCMDPLLTDSVDWDEIEVEFVCISIFRLNSMTIINLMDWRFWMGDGCLAGLRRIGAVMGGRLLLSPPVRRRT